MSKSTELDTAVKVYILGCMDFSSYEAKELTTTREKIKAGREAFYSEYKWAIKNKGELSALTEYLQGLPTWCGIAFYNCEILELAVKWGSLPADYSEKQADKILENYWRFMASKLAQLFRAYRIPSNADIAALTAEQGVK